MTDIAAADWPAIPYPEWRETCAALHLWTQMVGKYRLSRTPWLNHSWQVTLYVVPEGLTTGPVPDGGATSVTFDLRQHRLVVAGSRGVRDFALAPMSVARFHDSLRDAVEGAGGHFAIHELPNELPDPVRFPDDREERPYDADAVERFHRALLAIAAVFGEFRTGFVGKASPVHLFWGAFDLAVTRFSGRRAPEHPGGIPNMPDAITREAYSHEVSSAGFWPGGMGIDEPMFYSYAYPQPDGFAEADAGPHARWDADLGEFLLPYEAVRTSGDPAGTLMDFLQKTYAAAADLGGWDRSALECRLGQPGVPRPVES